MKFVPASETILYGCTFSLNMILAALIRSAGYRPSAVFMIGNML